MLNASIKRLAVIKHGKAGGKMQKSYLSSHGVIKIFAASLCVQVLAGTMAFLLLWPALWASRVCKYSKLVYPAVPKPAEKPPLKL